MDRPRGGDRFGDGGGRHSRMPPRWSPASGSPPAPHHRHPRGGGEGFSHGVRHHPYRGPPDNFPAGGPDSRGGFPDQIPIGGPKRGGGGFHGRGSSPEYNDRSKFAKLFIGSVPRTATEEDIRPVFEEQGDVIEVALIKDKRTGQQQGCCFVKYATSEEAERAIRALHNQYTLPGGSGPIQVRYADGERESFGTVEHKLFVATLHKQATEKEIQEIFSPYGHVVDIYLMRDDMKQGRGSGFVKFSTREMAVAAIEGLDGTYVMRGCDQPLTVRFANPKRPRPGESRGGPAFGGPGFGSRSEASSVIRPLSHLDEQMGGSMPPNAWHQRSPQSHGSSSQGGSNQGFGPQSTAKVAAASSAASGIPGRPTNGSHSNLTATTSSSQQSFNPSLQLHPAQHTMTSQSQVPQSVGLPPLTQQNAYATPLQAPQGIQQQGMHIQQLPSQLPQVLLQQQAQALQSSVQSSQQAIFQLQQQLHQIQQSGQQQGFQNLKQQVLWTEQQVTSTASASAPAAAVPSTSSATSVHQVSTSAPLTCDWTEHTSPQGFKYYYNRVTQESKWEKPDELTIFEQQQKLLLLQQQQQELAAQQLQSASQTQPQGQIQPSQQVSQTQQVQPQMQLRQQAQLQCLQPSLGYQASAVAGNQNIQDPYYAQLPVSGSAIDPSRVQQGIQAAQDWAWRNKPAGT